MLLALGVLASSGCKDKPASGDGPPRPEPAQAAPKPPPPPRPWYEGTWRGQAALLSVTPPVAADALERKGKPVPPPRDEGHKVTMVLTCDAQGAASGSLGELNITGQVDAEVIRADLASPDRAGVLLATRTEAGLSVEARFSAGDSSRAFSAQLLLTR